MDSVRTATPREMATVRMFGKKVVQELDGLRVTSYRYNGRIYVDGVKIVDPAKWAARKSRTGESR